MRLSTSGFVITFVLHLLVAPLAVEAQAPVQAARIGILRSAPDTPEVRRDLDAFTQVLRDHGYSAGQNATIAYRYPTELATPLSALVGELLQFKADVLVAAGPAAVEATRHTTSTIPIVALALETDPVANGLVERYSRPGGNLTRVFLDFPEFSGKWLELLREVVPGLTRVVVLWDPTAGPVQVRGLESAARAVRVQLHVLEVRRGDEFEGALRAAMSEHPGAVIALSSPVVNTHRRQLAALAVAHHLPAITLFPSFAHDGGLMAYGPNLRDLWRQTGVLVAKILHGAKPTDVPIERPTKFELVINLKTAQELGLTIPLTLLFQANEVIRYKETTVCPHHSNRSPAWSLPAARAAAWGKTKPSCRSVASAW
jgi:putative ABC transport system substrate-binding protein